MKQFGLSTAHFMWHFGGVFSRCASIAAWRRAYATSDVGEVYWRIVPSLTRNSTPALRAASTNAISFSACSSQFAHARKAASHLIHAVHSAPASSPSPSTRRRRSCFPNISSPLRWSRVSARTSWPPSSKARTTCRPTLPVAPATATRIFLLHIDAIACEQGLCDMAALRAKLSTELLPIDKECLLRCAAGALAIYSAFVARESKNNQLR